MYYPEIKRFVQKTLGCSCPENVFKKIVYQKAREGILGGKVDVGGRLLIYIITVDGKAGIQRVVHTALEQGVEERDNKGFNRFRLVLVASRPDALRSTAEQAFDSSEHIDEQTHLHIVDESDVRGL